MNTSAPTDQVASRTTASETTDSRSGRDTAAEVRARATAAGYHGRMVANNDGTVQCHSCRSATAATRLAVDRLEPLGTAPHDDAAEMLIIARARCTSCRRLATVTLGHGPNAGEADLAVLAALDLGALDFDERFDRPVH